MTDENLALNKKHCIKMSNICHKPCNAIAPIYDHYKKNFIKEMLENWIGNLIYVDEFDSIEMQAEDNRRLKIKYNVPLWLIECRFVGVKLLSSINGIKLTFEKVTFLYDHLNPSKFHYNKQIIDIKEKERELKSTSLFPEMITFEVRGIIKFYEIEQTFRIGIDVYQRAFACYMIKEGVTFYSWKSKDILKPFQIYIYTSNLCFYMYTVEENTKNALDIAGTLNTDDVFAFKIIANDFA